MKRVLIAALVLVTFSAAGFAQATPSTKKNETSKAKVEKSTNATDATAKSTAGKWHKGKKGAAHASSKKHS